jgi:hypothetical protein
MLVTKSEELDATGEEGDATGEDPNAQSEDFDPRGVPASPNRCSMCSAPYRTRTPLETQPSVDGKVSILSPRVNGTEFGARDRKVPPPTDDTNRRPHATLQVPPKNQYQEAPRSGVAAE